MNNITINIEGLEEKETQIKVKNQIEGIRGVHDASLSMDETCMEVIYDDQTSEAEINGHLQNNGYRIK